MPRLLDSLARFARPLLLFVAALLTLGALLAVTGMVLLGWAIYALGFVGLLVALPAVAAVYRPSMDWACWVTFAILYVGVVLGVPAVAVLLGRYAQDPALELLMPRALGSLAMWPGVIAWAGFGLFGLAMNRLPTFPRGGAVLLAIASLLAIPAEFGLLIPFAWAVAVILASLALVWVAPETQPEMAARRRASA